MKFCGGYFFGGSVSCFSFSAHTQITLPPTHTIHAQVLLKYCLFTPSCHAVLSHAIAGSVMSCSHWILCHNKVFGVPVYPVCPVFPWCIVKNKSCFISHLWSTDSQMLSICFTLGITYTVFLLLSRLSVFILLGHFYATYFILYIFRAQELHFLLARGFQRHR